MVETKSSSAIKVYTEGHKIDKEPVTISFSINIKGIANPEKFKTPMVIKKIWILDSENVCS